MISTIGRVIPRGAEYGWYDPRGEKWGTFYDNKEAAQRAVNVDFLNGDVDVYGVDEDGWHIAATDGNILVTAVVPVVVTNETLQAMIATALDCWDFDVDGGAAVRVELARMQGAEVDAIELNQNVASGEDFDGLEDWMERICSG